MNEFVMLGCMHLKREKTGTVIEKQATGYYTFIHFVNPIDVSIGGRIHKTSANACVIYTPDAYRYYAANSIDLFHNFLIFDLTDGDALVRRGIPQNSLFYTDRQEEITSCIESLEYYRSISAVSPEDRIDTKITELFDMLSDEQRDCRIARGQKPEVAMENLRTMIYRCPKSWDVSAMANYVHLSRAHFSVRYRETFGVSPGEDLTCAAMRYADRLLLTTDMTVERIAEECGFSGPEYFISLYKNRNGITPGQLRRAERSKNNS